MFHRYVRALIRLVIYSAVLALWVFPGHSSAHEKKLVACEDYLQSLTLTSTLLLKYKDITPSVSSEFLRLQILDFDRNAIEVAIYSGTDKDAAEVETRLGRLGRFKDVENIIAPKTVKFIDKASVDYVASILDHHPQIASMLRAHGRFARATYIDQTFFPLESAPKLESQWAFTQALQQLKRLEKELTRRHMAADELQMRISPVGELHLVNVEALKQGSRADRELAFAKVRKLLEAIRP